MRYVTSHGRMTLRLLSARHGWKGKGATYPRRADERDARAVASGALRRPRCHDSEVMGSLEG
jgi:hypothetical protein